VKPAQSVNGRSSAKLPERGRSVKLRRPSKKTVLSVFGVSALAVGAWVIGRSVTVWLGGDLGGYDAGALATFVGIIAGVPIALLIAQSQNERAGKTAAAERGDRAARVLDLIKNDLEEASEELAGRIGRSGIIAPFLGSGHWGTVKSNGDLALIDHPVVLYAITRAYDRIALTAYLERQLWEMVLDPFAGSGPRFSQRPAEIWLREALIGQDEHTSAAIVSALSWISRTTTARPLGGR
jgi:hypothetical protein